MDHLTSLEWIIQTRRCKAYITHDHMQPYSHLPETTRIELNQPSQMSLSIKYQLMKQGCLFHVCSLYQIHIVPPFFSVLLYVRTQRVWVTVKIREEKQKRVEEKKKWTWYSDQQIIIREDLWKHLVQQGERRWDACSVPVPTNPYADELHQESEAKDYYHTVLRVWYTKD